MKIRFVIFISHLLFFSGINYAQPLTIQWQKCLGGTWAEVGYSIKQLSDGTYFIGGTASSIDGDVTGNHTFGLEDYWIVRLDSAGILKWEKCYGGSDEEKFCTAIPNSNGGFTAAGASGSNDGDITGNHSSGDF